MLAPLVLLAILFGFYPAPLLDVTAVSVKKLVSNYETAKRLSHERARIGRSQRHPGSPR